MKLLLAALFSLLLVNVVTAQTQPVAKPAKHASLGTKDNSKYDSKLPIEISSDTLEVLQHDSKAVFKGNVVAVQGKLRLKSDIMIVHYKQKKDEPGKPAQPVSQPPAGAANAQGAMGAISRIEVEGNVLMASPEESAKGDKGDYDVDSKTIHLFGDNVILTREKNILRGTALEYNLETGRSLLTNGSEDVLNSKAGGGRVRGVFMPNDDAKTPKTSSH